MLRPPSTPVYMTQFQWVSPQYMASQAEIVSWIARVQSELTGRDVGLMERLVRRYAPSSSQVSQRYYSHGAMLTIGQGGFDRPGGILLEERMHFFQECVQDHFELLYANETVPPEQLVHVSCTGYVAPSAAQKLVALKAWTHQTEVLHAYHMGCYAAIPAVRAGGDALSRLSRVDVVHTELCSLHFNPHHVRPEHMVIQGLFGDGIVRYRLQRTRPPEPHLLWRGAVERIVPDSTEKMTWIPGSRSFGMSLARDVPELVVSISQQLVHALRGRDEPLLFAVHPGGPRILAVIQRSLELTDAQLRHSRAVLRQYGNISSATLPMIWKSILEDPTVPSGTAIISLAFGPGLTAFAARLEKGHA